MKTFDLSRATSIAVSAPLFLGLAVSAADFNELKAKADEGDTSAQMQLASAYDSGDGVAKDPTQAAYWCRKAAEQGLAEAQNCIGSMHQFGEGVPQDDVAAFTWYEKAAAQGYGEAYTNLGYMYDLGLGVAQDRAKAIDLYRQGAEKGSLNAMLNLGISYGEGAGVAADLVEAFMWLDLARFYTQQSNSMQLKWRVRGALDELKKKMSKAQIREGERRTRAWDEAHRPR